MAATDEITRPHPVIGVAGCGAMGLPMARALRGAGFDVRGFDVRPVSEFGDFADRMIASASVFAESVDIMISVVRDTRQTVDLYFDDQAIFTEGMHPKTCLLASTVPPGFVHDVAARLPTDVTLIDTPMSGAPIAAVEARLSFMVGCNEQAAAPIRPLLDAMGRDLHFLGGLGQGMTAKVLNNFVAASSVAAVRQVLAEADNLGLDPDDLLSVMTDSSGATWFGTNFDAISWAQETYDRDNTIGILEKDVNALLDSLRQGNTGAQAITYIETIRDHLRHLPKAPRHPGGK